METSTARCPSRAIKELATAHMHDCS